jgi:hypothetical protein
MFLTEPSGIEHVVQFVDGVPAKVRAGDGYAMFGELLIEDGVLSQKTLDDALATKGGLLGDVLALAGRVDTATLDWVAETQLVRRIVHLFELPAETRYRYHDRDRTAQVDFLALLWAGLRAHAERSTRLQVTLEALGDAPLRVHPGIDPGRFGFCESELAIIDRLRAGVPSLEALIASGIAAEDEIRRLVYALTISRYIDLGGGRSPVGIEEAPVSPSSQRLPPNQALARMALRSIAYRAGAAAPDPAGDGERRSPLPRSKPPLSSR